VYLIVVLVHKYCPAATVGIVVVHPFASGVVVPLELA